MICSPTFIKIYNTTFKFIHEELGHRAVEEYWKRIGPIVLIDLYAKFGRDLSWPKKYWEEVLATEKAVYSIDTSIHFYKAPSTEFEPPIEELILNIYECPSLKILGDSVYVHYCDHCTVMYKPIFDQHGYDYNVERKERGCRIRITKKKSVLSETEATPVPASM